MRVRLGGLLVAACAVLAFGCAVVLAAPGAGRPVGLRVHFTVVHGSVDTNGSYSLVTKADGASVVVNEITGAGVHLRLPGYCPKPTADPVLGDSWLMEQCGASQLALYSLASRRWRPVTIASSCVHFDAGPGSSCVIDAIGTHWMQFYEESTRFGDVAVFQSIAGGRLRTDPTNKTTFPDLDSARLARRLCRPLRVPSHTFVFFAFRRPFVIVTDEAGPTLERCGTRRHRALPTLQAGVGPGTVMWLATNGGLPKVDGIFLPSLRRFRVAPPHAATDLNYIQLSKRHIYLSGSTRSHPGVTWSAPLPVTTASSGG